MPVSCQEIISLLEMIAPPKMAESWDQGIGLQLGDPDQIIENVMFSLDLDSEVLAEAIDKRTDLLVVHHTPFFRPLKNLRRDTVEGRLISEMVIHGMSLYAMHTNLDSVSGGVSDVLAEKLELRETVVLIPGWKQSLFKLVVYTPESYADRIKQAFYETKAGWIGNYADCTFLTRGFGTFRPLENTSPFCGKQGELENVEEVRIETIVTEERLEQTVNTMLQVHPYEEPAYDILPLANGGHISGLGRVGFLPREMALWEFAAKVKDVLKTQNIRCCGDMNTRIIKAALCGGSGADYWRKALKSGAQVYLTADIKYHEAQDAVANGICLVDAGHYATEKPVMHVLAARVERSLRQKGIRVVVSAVDTNPFVHF